MNKSVYLSLLFLISIFFNHMQAQEINWVYLPGGVTNNACTSQSDANEGIACFGLEYTPGVTGTMTSYTVGYLVDCNQGFTSIDTAFSCVMLDATDIITDCDAFGASFLQTSANSGNIPVELDVPIIIHQVCLNVGIGDSIQVIFEDILGATTSIDLPGGLAVTDEPIVPTSIILTDSIYGLISCVDTTVCSLNFDTTSNLVLFPTNINGYILDASSDTTTSAMFSLDIYDEINELCGKSGGVEDIEITMNLLSTEDQYGNGEIDSLAGETHRIFQDTSGLVVEIPFGTNLENETSTGDVRGFSMKVVFAEHIEIIADQLSVNVSNINESSGAFESAALVFLDVNGLPFDTLTYNGFFIAGADLSGDCTLGMMSSSPWAFMGNGVGTYVISDQASVDLTDPCQVAGGTTMVDTLMIHARLDAGLDSATIVQGFELIVFGEDVAAPSTIDDGSGSAPDDGIAGNTATSTSTVLMSKVLGYKVEGCVFKQEILPVQMVSFEASQEKSGVLLEWKTTNEVNHSHFELEWSTDGRSFSIVGKVSGGKVNVSYNQYNYLHTNPEVGYNYYRIKQVDVDGRFEYSDIRSIAMVDAQAEVTIYPNPVGDKLTLNFSRPLENCALIRIINTHGQEMIVDSLQAGSSSHFLSTESLPFGHYIILVDSKAYRFIKN